MLTAVYFGGVRVMANETGIYIVALTVVILAMTLLAVLVAGVGVAVAVPYLACDPLWKLLGWC